MKLSDKICWLGLSDRCSYIESMDIVNHIELSSIIKANELSKCLKTNQCIPNMHLIDGVLPHTFIYEGSITTGWFKDATLVIRKKKDIIKDVHAHIHCNRNYLCNSNTMEDIASIFSVTSKIINASEKYEELRNELDPYIQVEQAFNFMISTQFIKHFFNIDEMSTTEIEKTLPLVKDILLSIVNIKLMNLREINTNKPLCVSSLRTNVLPVFTGTSNKDMHDYIDKYDAYKELVPNYKKLKWHQHICSPLTPLIIANAYHSAIRAAYDQCKMYMSEVSLDKSAVKLLDNTDIQKW